MRRKPHTFVALTLAALCGSLGGCGAGGQSVHYTVDDIGTLPRGLHAYGMGISSNGDVVGKSDGILEGDISFREHAFLWHDGQIRDLGVFGGEKSWAKAVNSSGMAVGDFETTDSSFGHAFLFDGSASRRLPSPPQAFLSEANAISEDGRVAGMTLLDGYYRAVTWRQGTMNDLGVLPDCNSSKAFGINSTGDVAGESFYEEPVQAYSRNRPGRAGSFTHAFLYRDGQMKDLGTLGGTNSSARAVNDQGLVVGEAELPSGARHACLWSGGHGVDLGTLGGPNSVALGINNAGQIVGMSDSRDTDFLGNPVQRPFLYTNGVMRDLTGLMPSGSEFRLISVGGINDRGQIVGTAERILVDAWRPRAVVLSPAQ